MATGKDTEERSREVMRETEQAIARAEAQLKEGAETFRKLNVAPGDSSRFLASGKVSAQDRAKAEKELDEWRQEVERDVEAQVSSAKQAKPKTKVKPGAMRV